MPTFKHYSFLPSHKICNQGKQYGLLEGKSHCSSLLSPQLHLKLLYLFCRLQAVINVFSLWCSTVLLLRGHKVCLNQSWNYLLDNKFSCQLLASSRLGIITCMTSRFHFSKIQTVNHIYSLKAPTSFEENMKNYPWNVSLLLPLLGTMYLPIHLCAVDFLIFYLII